MYKNKVKNTLEMQSLHSYYLCATINMFFNTHPTIATFSEWYLDREVHLWLNPMETITHCNDIAFPGEQNR